MACLRGLNAQLYWLQTPVCFLLYLRNTPSIAYYSLAHHLSYADSIIVLNSDGKVVEQGSYNELVNTSSHVSAFSCETGVSDPVQEPIIVDDNILQELQLDEDVQDAIRQTGDLTVYKYYFQTVGLVLTVAFLSCSAAFVFFMNFPRKSFH